MWSLARLAIAVVVVAALVAAGYAELVLDLRAPRVVLDEAAFVTTHARLASGSDALDAKMKAKYGPNVQTGLQLKPPLWVATVDDKIVHREPATLTFSAAIGFIAIGSPGKIASLFPFRLELREKQPSHRFSLEELRMWLGQVNDDRISRYLDVNDAGEVDSPCVDLASSDFGWIGQLLYLRTGRFCLIDSAAGRRASALVGAVIADGDPWMRPFTGRICRGLTALALHKIAAVRPRLPEYAACLMVDRPGRRGTAALSFHDFAVGADGKLARTLLPKSSGNGGFELPRLR
jgi:hypothetical protein